MKNKKAQLTLDSFLNIKNKRRQFFYLDFNTTDSIPLPIWCHSKPKVITWSKVVKWKEMGDIIVCANNPYIKTDNTNDMITKINSDKEEYNNKLISFLKSHLQKSIRRQQTKSAIHSALKLIIINKEEFVRRLSIIVFEDVELKEYYPTLIWLISAFSKGFYMNDKILELLLSFVIDICNHNHYDDISDYINENDNFDMKKIYDSIETSSIEEKNKNMLYSILFRVSYGGMFCDIEMLKGYTDVWYQRFQKGLKASKISIPENYLNLCDYNYLLKNPLTENEYVKEGIDFHCFPFILNELLKITDDKYSKEDIQLCIWEYNSKINTRKDNTVNNEKLELIWNDIKTTLHNQQAHILSDMILHLNEIYSIESKTLINN
jgi:hypothetical protein